jgi:signal transduction histidine kinase
MRLRTAWPWLFAWLLIAALGAFGLDIASRREAFQAEARTAHRLISQRAAQHDAILATLALLEARAPDGERAEERLIAVYPQVLKVLRREGDAAWPLPGLAEAESRARAARDSALGPVALDAGHFWLVRAGSPSSYALQVSVERMLPREAPFFAADGPVRAALAFSGTERVLQEGTPPSMRPAGLTAGFVFSAPLSAASQPFELRLSRATGPAEWPWVSVTAWSLGSALAIAAIAAGLQARAARQRAGQLARLHRTLRLNAMGEFAGGVAHELNQPLTAVLASTQAAQRLLGDEEPDLVTAREAMSRAATQARRAADVLARLRQAITQPGAPGASVPLELAYAVRGVLGLLEPALAGAGVEVRLEGTTPTVRGDPVALEQILHNLIDNAIKALAAQPQGGRRLAIAFATEGPQGVCRVTDSGPGIAPDILEHLFEPLNTSREGGMGLGLALARSQAEAMGGTLAARNASGAGAEFRLSLPLAPA